MTEEDKFMVPLGLLKAANDLIKSHARIIGDPLALGQGFDSAIIEACQNGIEDLSLLMGIVRKGRRNLP